MPVVVNNEDRELEFRPSAVSDDEIDLVQLTQILLKRKYLILGVIVFCLLVGGSYAFLKERVYLYTTSLQIGEVLIDGKGSTKKVAIEAPPSVKLKIEKVYIPVAAEKLRTNGENRLVKAVVREKKNSNIIFVESKGNSADQQTISQFHSLIISPLIENHRDGVSALKRQFELLADKASLVLKDLENPVIFGAEEKKLQQLVETAQMKLAQFDDRKKLLLANKAGLGETGKLLIKQINYIEKNLELSRAKRNRAISETNDATKAMTFLLLNNDIQQNENRLAELKERLYVGLANEKQALEGQFAANQRGRENQVAKIDELKSDLAKWKAQHLSSLEEQRNVISVAKNKVDLFHNTKTLGLAIQSVEPVGPRKALILALSGILGLMGGIMLAFIAEFMAKVKQQQVKVDEDG